MPRQSLANHQTSKPIQKYRVYYSIRTIRYFPDISYASIFLKSTKNYT